MGRRDNQAKDDRKKAKVIKKLARKQNTKTELKRIIIACEGEVTERSYFQDFFDELIDNHKISKTSFVIAKHKHSNPTGVLTDLLKALEKDSEFEHKWIVIDRDEERTGGGGHTKQDFNNAIKQANSKKIKTAYSNPSFELWYLLHYQFRNTAIDRDEVVTTLTSNINYKKNTPNMYHQLKPLQHIAIRNSKELLKRYSPISPSDDNPSTTVHELVELLNGLD